MGNLSRSLNVAMFTETFVPHANGVTTSILNARRGLYRRGHRVVVYSAGPPVLENDSVHYYGGKVFPLYPDFPIAIYPTRAARHSKRAFRAQQADLVHVHAPGPMGLRGYWSAKKQKLPVVVTYHTVLEPLVRYAPFGWKTFYRLGSTAVDGLLNRRSRILIAPTHATRRHLIEKHPQLESKIRVVPSGIDMKTFRPGLDASRIRAAWGFESGERVMLYLGRTAFEKRIDVLLRAYERLHKTQPDLRFVVAGTGPALQHHKQWVHNRGLQDAIKFAGHVPDADLPLYYNACDVFTSASEIETQGLTLLEAMACGASPAVAAAGGFLDLVKDGDNGFLFPAGSTDGAVHAIELALAAPPRLRGRARETALLYGVDHCITLLERAYMDALEGADAS